MLQRSLDESCEQRMAVPGVGRELGMKLACQEPRVVRQLHHLDQDEDALQELLLAFRGWRAVWDERGFMRMFQRLLFPEKLCAEGPMPTKGMRFQ